MLAWGLDSRLRGSDGEKATSMLDRVIVVGQLALFEWIWPMHKRKHKPPKTPRNIVPAGEVFDRYAIKFCSHTACHRRKKCHDKKKRCKWDNIYEIRVQVAQQLVYQGILPPELVRDYKGNHGKPFEYLRDRH